jgi:hypothetical protein
MKFIRIIKSTYYVNKFQARKQSGNRQGFMVSHTKINSPKTLRAVTENNAIGSIRVPRKFVLKF